MNTYAGKVEDGIVVDAIVGTAEWAVKNLGGEWHDSPDKIWVPGIWDEVNGFQPMPEPDPEEEVSPDPEQ